MMIYRIYLLIDNILLIIYDDTLTLSEFYIKISSTLLTFYRVFFVKNLMDGNHCYNKDIYTC